jgi:hypothetical protein
MAGDLVKQRFITHKVAGYGREDNNHKKNSTQCCLVLPYRAAQGYMLMYSDKRSKILTILTHFIGFGTMPKGYKKCGSMTLQIYCGYKHTTQRAATNNAVSA